MFPKDATDVVDLEKEALVHLQNPSWLSSESEAYNKRAYSFCRPQTVLKMITTIFSHEQRASGKAAHPQQTA